MLDRTKIPDLKPLLAESIEPVGEGVCKYKNGENDETLAVQFDCSPNAIAALRRKWFGRLYAPRPKTEEPTEFNADAYERVLEKQKLFEEALKELTGRMTIVEDYITRNP
jgi:hypothetical protein